MFGVERSEDDVHSDVAGWMSPQKSSRNAELALEGVLQGISEDTAPSGVQNEGHCDPHDSASDTVTQDVPTYGKVAEHFVRRVPSS